MKVRAETVSNKAYRDGISRLRVLEGLFRHIGNIQHEWDAKNRYGPITSKVYRKQIYIFIDGVHVDTRHVPQWRSE